MTSSNTLTKIDLIKMFIEAAKDAEDWADEIPSSIRSAFIDNEYVNSYWRVMDNSLKLLLSDTLHQDIVWWAYDGRRQVKLKGSTTISVTRGVAEINYHLKSDEDYIAFLQIEYKDALK